MGTAIFDRNWYACGLFVRWTRIENRFILTGRMPGSLVFGAITQLQPSRDGEEAKRRGVFTSTERDARPTSANKVDFLVNLTICHRSSIYARHKKKGQYVYKLDSPLKVLSREISLPQVAYSQGTSLFTVFGPFSAVESRCKSADQCLRPL